jgi:PAS domain S-box-containing protein
MPGLLRRLRTDLPLVLSLALGLAVVGTVSWHMQAEVEREGIAGAGAESRNLARLLSLHGSEMLQRIDLLQPLARLATRAHLAGDPGEPALLDELRRAVDLAGPHVVQVSAIDPAGDMIWSTLAMPPERVNLAQRDYFQAIAGEGRDRVVSRPVRGVVSGRWIFQFAEALRGPDRALQGITVVSVDARLAEALARELNITDHGVIAIIHNDGVLLSRYPELFLGQVIPAEGSLWRAALQTGAAERLVPSPSDGVLRFYAARRIADSEIIMLIGLDAADRMAPIQQATAQIGRTTAALCLALTGFAFLVGVGVRRQRMLDRERQHSHDLGERQAMLRQFAEHSADLITLLDGSMNIIYTNAAYRSQLGTDPQAMIGRRFGSRSLPQDTKVVEAAMTALVRDGGTQRIDYRVRHEYGGFRWLESEIVAIAEEERDSATACRYIATSREITSRKQAEKALQATREQLEMLLWMGPGMLYQLSISPDGKRQDSISSNNLLCRLGYRPEQLVPGFLLPRVHPADVPVQLAAIDRCLHTGEATVEYRFPTAGGDLRWFRDELRLAGPQGELTILIGYVTDITAERESETRRQQGQRLATLGEVAAGIAHELNQPLAAIAMAAENGDRALSLDPPGVPTAARKFLRIREQAQRLGTVIDQIRMFGRKEAVPSVAFTLDEVVQNTLQLVASRLESTETRIEVDLPPDLPPLRGAPFLLEQVLMNVVVNACDAYAELAQRTGGAADQWIRIAARREGDDIVISVADRAGGIPPDVIDRVFNPFFTTKAPGKGTGLGLSISLATVTGMGGRIGVRNEAGGTVLDIYLPMATDTDAAAEAKPAPARTTVA